jgi:tRNA-modifying protein YgfZ
MPTLEVELDGQYRLLREEAGAVDRSERGKLRVAGPEAGDLLQGQLTNDVEALAPGAGCYAALLDRKGHMQADMRVLRVEDGAYWLDTETASGPAVLRHLTTYRIGREVELDDETEARTILSVIGPAAARAAGIETSGPEHSHRSIEVAGARCVAVATDLGVDLICATEHAVAVLDALAAAGAPQVSEAAAEILRVETGRPRFGHEMTTETIPQEAGINERAVSFTKGCYIGQETVARLHYKGKPNRHLRGLRLSGAASAGDAIALGDREVGHVGTFALSPALGPIALAIVRREAEPGADVTVGAAGTRAEVAELPF